MWRNYYKNHFKNWILIILLLLMLPMILSACSSDEHVFIATKGTMDLTQWNDKENPIVNLEGEWEVYPNQLIPPEDFEKPLSRDVDYFYVPGTYKTMADGSTLSKDTYTTLRLKVELPPNSQKMYGLIVKPMMTASQIWINGVPMSEVGTVTETSWNAVGSLERQLIVFNVDKQDIDIVIHAANYNNITGKIRGFIFGEGQVMKRAYIKDVFPDIFISGALVIMAIYHFALYSKRRNMKAFLYFGLFCLIISTRNILVGARLIYEFVPTLSFEWLNKFAYLTVFLSLPFMVLFFKNIFPTYLKKISVTPLSLIAFVLSLIVLLTNVQFYDKFLLIYEVIFVIYFIIILVGLIKEIKQNRRSSGTVLLGTFIFSLTIINDALLQAGIIYTRSLASLGFFVFIFSQAYVLAEEFSDAHHRIEKLIEENKAIYYDSLTGLYNRRGFYEKAENTLRLAKKFNQKFAIIYGDLNRFKLVNDTYGHKEGDEAITMTAKLLMQSFRDKDIVARMSGDEFIVIVNDTDSTLEIDMLIKKVYNRFNKYNRESDKPYALSISLGYSIYSGQKEMTLDELVYRADLMLYKNKQKYRRDNGEACNTMEEIE